MAIILSNEIYKSRSVDELIRNISLAAMSTGLAEDSEFAAKMLRAHALTSDYVIRDQMAEILNLIRKNPGRQIIARMREAEKAEREKRMAENGEKWVAIKPRTIESAGRIKSVYSTAMKLLLLQEDNRQSKKEGNHPREGFINDLYACRFIIEDNHDMESIGFAFDFFNDTLEFLEDQCNCVVLQSSGPVKTTNFCQEEHPELLHPTEEMKVLDRFKGKHKDYYHFPKGNGYQCLHASILDQEYGFIFEIQVLTRTSFEYVNQEESDEEGKEVNEDNVRTSHAWHKNQKYGKLYAKQGILDLPKVKMDGFYFDDQEKKLTDSIMLVKPGCFL